MNIYNTDTTILIYSCKDSEEIGSGYSIDPKKLCKLIIIEMVGCNDIWK